MRKILSLTLAFALMGAVAGYYSTATPTATPSDADFAGISGAVGGLIGTTATGKTINNNLARISSGSLPQACAIVAVAEGYFEAVKAKVPAKALAVEAKAADVIKIICDNPPADVSAALADLYREWLLVQAATKV